MKNKTYSYTLSGLFLLAITALSVTAAIAQGRYINTYSKSTVAGFINRLENSSNAYRRDFDRYMDRSNLDGTREEDRLNRIVANYEDALDRLRNDFNGRRNWWDSRSDVQQMINQAGPVNTMMVNLPFGRNIESQWRAMRNDINKVADTYDLPGLAGGGWMGGGNNNGGGVWNGGGNRVNPPSWAIGTFYGTDNQGRRVTVTIDRSGYVNANTDGTPFSGAFVSGNMLSFQDGTSRVTREGNGFWTTRTSNGERTFFSSRGYNDGPGSGYPGGGGERINPPNWAVGTFYGTDSAGRRVTVNISRNGMVSADTDGTPFNGTFIRGNMLSFADGTSRVTREGNGFWTTRTSNGERTFFSTNRNSGGGGWNGGGNTGNRINPPDWAVGSFYGTDSAGRRVTVNITRTGDVYANTDGVQFNGTFIQGNMLSFADGTSRVTREGNGFWTTRTSNGERTFFRR